MTSRSRVDDMVVVVPGILGSRLADAEGREVWGLSGPALLRGIRTFGRSVKGLTLPPDLGDEHPGDGVRPLGPMRDLHGLLGIGTLVDGYDGLLEWLESHFTLRRRGERDAADAPANLIGFAYDWRLSCRHSADRLAERVDEELGRWRASAPERAEARVVLLCHSMGGLVARQYVERCGGAEVTRRVITLGTPYRGSLDALLSLVDGVGPAGMGLTALARGLPSLHQLVPDYAALITAPGEPLRHAREVTGLPGTDAGREADRAAHDRRDRRGRRRPRAQALQRPCGRGAAARVHALGETRLAPEQHGTAPGPLQLAHPGPAGPPRPAGRGGPAGGGRPGRDRRGRGVRAAGHGPAGHTGP
ncbi:hypothetical protein [Streptomyces sp. NPDC053813]|uniref:lipase/acyltransferase domain-containing protein n=1 Tax=Streptomyces sp. NPDC053813 TaxID=3365717 RepID=UPI0037D16F44